MRRRIGLMLWCLGLCHGCGATRYDVHTAQGRARLERAVEILGSVVLLARSATPAKSVAEWNDRLNSATDEVLRLESLFEDGRYTAAAARLPCTTQVIMRALATLSPEVNEYLRGLLNEVVDLDHLTCMVRP